MMEKKDGEEKPRARRRYQPRPFIIEGWFLEALRLRLSCLVNSLQSQQLVTARFFIKRAHL